MNLTRRWFILGSGSALAAARLGSALPKEQIIEVPLTQAYKTNSFYNEIIEISILNNSTSIVRFDVKRDFDGDPFLVTHVGSGGIYSWLAPPENAIFLHKDKSLIVECSSDPGDTVVSIVNNNNGNPFIELYSWVNGVCSTEKIFRKIQSAA